MALTTDAMKRRLEQSVVTKQPVEEEQTPYGATYTKQPVSGPPLVYEPSGSTYRSQPVATTSSPYRTTATSAPTADYAPGEGSQINYGEQRYSNGVHASPTISQADLPKYENVDQFDFNRNYEDTLDQLQRQRADLQQQNDLATQRVQEDYQRRFREIQQQQQDAMNLDAERMASRGILRSGLAVKSAGSIGGEFGGELDQQQRALSQAIEDQNASYSQAERGIQEQIGKAQEYLTRQQQMLEEQRARQAAAAAAAQRGAFNAGEVAQQKKPTVNVVKDNLGKYFVVDPESMTRQQLTRSAYKDLGNLYTVNQYDSLAGASDLFGSDYVANANALARRLGGDLSGKASLDVRLGFNDIGKWGG